jgi:hypothetical protein
VTSERVQARITRLLDEAEEAADRLDWDTVRKRAEGVLVFDPENADAKAFLAAAERGVDASPASSTPQTTKQPDAFAAGRYVVRRFLGEGGKKKVYLAHDARLDRDVAFALIKTDGLDEAARERITREAQAMGRLGTHPNIVTVYDIGEEAGQPYLVLPVLEGGDVEGLIEKAREHKLPVGRIVEIGVDTCEGLEFLHARGLVHRDVKPGNTWLTREGRAMIGDFGLAVAVDRSRLTQAGMMVGTVSYMAPEQAMGGEVTPRADLYALGAMLYEMVCGRPPFVGDESVAIIGQHLNTPPVAPSWHRPDCPPALETLILRLLEKDPQKRPTSAAEVRDALRAVESARPEALEGRDSAITVGPPSLGADPLYRTVFVGREQELKQLQSAFDAAMSGQGGLVMVVGEPGIGKTAICQQLATYVSLRGGHTLVGHCYEEGSLSLPYLAFVEAMRTYVLARDPDGLKSDLGSGAADVARIVSEVRDRVSVELRDAGDPEDDRWRLLQSITTFLRNAASVQPLCIVLEDLHWADRGTLDLLQHVARNLQGSRLVIVGTYRDVEVDRSHPLSGAVAELRRSGTFLRVPLRGLTVDEVHRMYEQIRGQSVAWAQAEIVHRATEGNPLFVQEVLRYLVEEGIVQRESGRYVAQAPGVGIPDGLRDVVGKRLSRLSERANQVLAIAAVIGRDFRLDVLQQVAGLGDEEVLAALEEAQERAIIEQRDVLGTVGFRFTHAFFRQTLYEEIFTPRRIRLHQQVGRALEDVYAKRLEEHAAELAEHFTQSTEGADLEKAVRYGSLAAERALHVYAYSEAIRHLEQALRSQEVLDPDDVATECDLMMRLGEAQLPLGSPGVVANAIAEKAYTLAEAAGDAVRASKACRLAFDALDRQGNVTPMTASVWIERADRQAPPESRFRVYADMALRGNFEAQRSMTVPQRRAERSRLERGFALALRLDELDLLFYAAWHLIGPAALTPKGWKGCLDVVSEVESRPRTGAGSRNLARFLIFGANARLMSADRVGWDRLGQELTSLAERTQDVNIQQSAQSYAATNLMLAGRLDEAALLARRSHDQGSQAGILTNMTRVTWYQSSSYQRHVAEVLRDAPEDIPALSTWSWRTLALGTATYGAAELEELRSALGQPLQNLAVRGADELGELPAVTLGDLLVAAIHLKDTTAIRSFMALDEFRRMPFTGMAIHRSIAHLYGVAAAVLGDTPLARTRFEESIVNCERLPHRPELALTHLDLAELLLEHYPDERDAAIKHLDFAIAELREMKMQPALERALRHRGLLKA